MYISWLIIQIKQNICSIRFYIIGAILLLTCALSGYVSKGHSEDIRVLLMSEDSEAGDEITDYLCSNAAEGFVFEVSDSEDEIYEAIVRGEAICGFVFTEDLDDAIRKNDPDGEVIIYQASDSLDGYLVKEIVYPAILRYSSKDLLNGYLDELEAGDEESGFVLDCYEKILKIKNIDIYEAVSLSSGEEKEAHETVSPSSGEYEAVSLSSGEEKGADETVGPGSGEEKGADETRDYLSAVLVPLVLILLSLIGSIEACVRDRHFFKVIKKKTALILCLESAAVNLVMYGFIAIVYCLWF